MENTRKIETKGLTKMAILAALIFFGTYFIKIPGINGYTHFGDCMIFIAVFWVAFIIWAIYDEAEEYERHFRYSDEQRESETGDSICETYHKRWTR